MKRNFFITIFIALLSFGAFCEEMAIAFFDPILVYCTPDEKNWIPTVVNNALVSQMNRYSDLLTFDSATLATTLEQIKKSENAVYDERMIIEAGKLINADYLCYIKVIKISRLFNVYFNIINATTGIPVATYEDDCTMEDLYKGGKDSIVNKAVLKMLEEDMGGRHSAKSIESLKKTMVWKSSGKGVTERDNDFRVAFLPPVLINCDDIWMRELLPGRLANAFFSYSKITPLDQGVEKSAIEKIKMSESGIYDEATITEAGKLVSAPYYCYASITHAKAGIYQTYFNLIATKTGKPIAIYHISCSADWIRGIKGFNVVDLAVHTMLTEDLGGEYNNESTESFGKVLQKQLKTKDVASAQEKSSQKYTVYEDKIYVPPKERAGAQKSQTGGNSNAGGTNDFRKRLGF